MTMITAEQAQAVLDEADMVCSAQTVTAALERLAAAITARLRDCNPLLLVVMNGGMIPAVWLLNRLDFPLQIGYVHATRYRGTTQGGELHWLAPPRLSVEDRVVLVIDDIFDEGVTLKAIVEHLRQAGARTVYSAVLVDKQHDRKVPGFSVDFVGLTIVDRYVFGCGMDYHEYWRNLPAIYAIKE
ncbi:MAG TPA: hypoxanthine-guanine phosphoribosyltransferase [Candidatus Competibacteraceae bacterium]|nr:hypoxanthine-guanine phosphoribosyltransferase [Candidatus Competibacteraceae bacterium]